MDLILDTNIYRNLVRNLTDEHIMAIANTIKEKCRQDNITLFFPIHSAMELISHFNDQAQTEQHECRNALKLLVTLATLYSSNRLHVDFVPPLNAILEKHFFENEDKHSKMYIRVVTLAQMLVGNIVAEEEDQMNSYIETVKRQIEFEKKKSEIITKII